MGRGFDLFFDVGSVETFLPQDLPIFGKSDRDRGDLILNDPEGNFFEKRGKNQGIFQEGELQPRGITLPDPKIVVLMTEGLPL